jgi:hypothetical protein
VRRSSHGKLVWLARAGALLRVVIVAFVAVLASGVVHAHQATVDAACDDGEIGCTHEDEGDSDCPEDLCGPAHHCGCCSPLVVTCPSIAKVLAAAGRQIMRPHAASAGAASGVRSRIERPPRR